MAGEKKRSALADEQTTRSLPLMADAPRLAASVVLIRRGLQSLEVLLALKSAKLRDAAGLWVFPGGKVEGGESLQTAAARECFEEVGVLLGKRAAPTPRPWRRLVSQSAAQWPAMLQAEQVVLAPLQPLCAFVTPRFEGRGPRRFENHMFVAEYSEAVHGPVAVDGGELTRAVWLTPAAALAQFAAGEMAMLPPQFYVLSVLCPYASVDACLAGLAPMAQLPPMQPMPLPASGEAAPAELSSVRSMLLPFDEMHADHPGKSGWRHRMVMDGQGLQGMRLEASALEKLALRERL